MTTDLGRDAFVDFLLESGDDAIRGAIEYDGEETELLHLRADVDGDSFRRRMVFTTRQAIHEYRHGDDVDTVGGSNAHVELFDGVAAVHLRNGPDAGVVVTFDVAATADLGAFVDQCRRVLSSDSSASAATGD